MHVMRALISNAHADVSVDVQQPGSHEGRGWASGLVHELPVNCPWAQARTACSVGLFSQSTMAKPPKRRHGTTAQ